MPQPRIHLGAILKPDIGKHPLGCSLYLYGDRLINYRAI